MVVEWTVHERRVHGARIIENKGDFEALELLETFTEVVVDLVLVDYAAEFLFS